MCLFLFLLSYACDRASSMGVCVCRSVSGSWGREGVHMRGEGRGQGVESRDATARKEVREKARKRTTHTHTHLLRETKRTNIYIYIQKKNRDQQR